MRHTCGGALARRRWFGKSVVIVRRDVVVAEIHILLAVKVRERRFVALRIGEV